MNTHDTEQLQITYYKNMEFFREYNPKLFAALTEEPLLYNLHIDSYGYNIIHLPTQAKQYPIIARHIDTNAAPITPQTHISSMQEAHSELAKDPMSNPKWELHSHYGAPFHTHFINEEKLPTTGKNCNTLLKEGMRMGIQAFEDSQKDSSNCARDLESINAGELARGSQAMDLGALDSGESVMLSVAKHLSIHNNTIPPLDAKEDSSLSAKVQNDKVCESHSTPQSLRSPQMESIYESTLCSQSDTPTKQTEIGKSNDCTLNSTPNQTHAEIDESVMLSVAKHLSIHNNTIPPLDTKEDSSLSAKVQNDKIQESSPCSGWVQDLGCKKQIHESTRTDEAQDDESKIHEIKAKPNIATQSNAILSQAILQAFQDSKLLPQTNIYGLMGGLFLQQLLEEGYSFHSLLIYEEHIDFFRISLYFLDYALLFSRVSARSCFIIIKDISLPLVRAFLYAKKLTNNVMSLSLTHYTTPNVTALKECIDREKKSIMRGWGSLEDEIIGLKNALHNLKDCKLLSTTPKRAHAPICVIGNGASLDLCLDFLQIYQDSMILISCGTALKVLRVHGITPDFQLEIERVPYLSEVLQEAGLGDIPLLFAQTTDTKACALSVERYGFLRGGSSSAYLDSGYPALEFSAPFVGNAGVCIGALLGSDVILCGIDCGYILGYSKHAKGSFYGDEGTLIPQDCFQVEGAKSLPVFSNDLFYLSAKNIEEAIKLYQPNSAINLGYGMHFAHTLSLHEDSFELKPINKAQELEQFKANFTPYQLKHESATLIALLKDYESAFKEIGTQKLESLQDVFTFTQSIVTFMQKNIDDSTNRASMILLEGSITHLSYTHILAQCFVRVTKDSREYESRAKLQQLYMDSIQDCIQACIFALQ